MFRIKRWPPNGKSDTRKTSTSRVSPYSSFDTCTKFWRWPKCTVRTKEQREGVHDFWCCLCRKSQNWRLPVVGEVCCRMLVLSTTLRRTSSLVMLCRTPKRVKKLLRRTGPEKKDTIDRGGAGRECDKVCAPFVMDDSSRLVSVIGARFCPPSSRREMNARCAW